MFGNTRDIARATAEGLAEWSDVSITDVDSALLTVPADATLVVAGGPTHAFSMSRPATRSDALRQADAPGIGSETTGIREWIDVVAPAPDLRIVTFDTRVKKPLIPGSAARSAAGSLRSHGFGHAERGETFWVLDTPGPLKESELERAREWGRSLAG